MVLCCFSNSISRFHLNAMLLTSGCVQGKQWFFGWTALMRCTGAMLCMAMALEFSRLYSSISGKAFSWCLLKVIQLILTQTPSAAIVNGA